MLGIVLWVMMFNMAVVVHKIDNVSIKIDTEDFDFLCLIREYFSFFADGYQFHPRFKQKQWDGKIRLLQTSGLMPLGLVGDVESFCGRHNKTIHIDPSIRTNNLEQSKFDAFVGALDVHSGGDSIDPYYYQKDAALFALNQLRCILLSPTSSGKSLIQYILLRMYEKILPGERVLIIVPTVGLVTQMKGDFADYSSSIDWSSDESVTGVAKGYIVDDDKQIVISTYQSLSNAKTKPPKEFFHQFKAVMVDEVHTAKAKSIVEIMNNCVNAEYRVGLTGTLDECKTYEMVLKGMFGAVMNVISTHELMEQGKVANLKIKTGVLNYPEDQKKFMRSAPRGAEDANGKKKREKATYVEEIEYIVGNELRNRFIMRHTAGLEGNSILMINQVEHGENLYNWMKKSLPDRDIFLYTGATDKDERERIRNVMEKSDNAIIIGSLGVLSTGISIKRLHNMVFAHPSKSRVKVLQSVGRLLRKSVHGNDVVMYDLVDDFSIGAYENYTLGHGRDRVRFYHDQKFDIDTILVDL